MPTAAKLVAGVFFAALGWFLADLIKPLLPEGRPLGYFAPGLAAVGLLVGWRFTGRRLGAGQGGGFGIGLSSSFLLLFWGMLVFASYEMLKLSFRKAYDGPVSALKGVIEISLEYGLLIAQPDIIGTLLMGGILGGWLTQFIARRWS